MLQGEKPWQEILSTLNMNIKNIPARHILHSPKIESQKYNAENKDENIARRNPRRKFVDKQSHALKHMKNTKYIKNM